MSLKHSTELTANTNRKEGGIKPVFNSSLPIVKPHPRKRQFLLSVLLQLQDVLSSHLDTDKQKLKMILLGEW